MNKMSELNIPKSADALVRRLKHLHKRRQRFPRPPRRLHLHYCDRRLVFKKTGGLCHLCGGKLDGDDFAADHVLSHAAGGKSEIDNFLPAHGLCNGSRWFYSDEEFKWILRMGVWARKQIEDETKIGRDMVPVFLKKEEKNEKRRNSKKKRYTFAANA
jgi:5-methylcytosine-specific restriction endonuclease McrA